MFISIKKGKFMTGSKSLIGSEVMSSHLSYIKHGKHMIGSKILSSHLSYMTWFRDT